MHAADREVARLRAAGAKPREPTPAVARALGPRALEPPEVVPLGDLAPSDPVGAVARRTFACSVARLLEHDPRVRLGDDPEAVHEARVATRRLRSDLRTFRSLLDPDWAAGLGAELRWLGIELGAIRDTQVLLALLRARIARLDPEERSVAEGLLSPLVSREDEARLALLGALRSPRYAALLDRLVDAARAPALLPDATRPAAEVLPALMIRPWRQLRAAVEALPRVPSDAALHTVRIRAKRARYAAEAAAPVVGKRASRRARALARLQDVLGAQHDAVQAIAWLRDAARGMSPEDAFVAGGLARNVRAEERAARAAWRRAWKAAARKGLRDQW